MKLRKVRITLGPDPDYFGPAPMKREIIDHVSMTMGSAEAENTNSGGTGTRCVEKKWTSLTVPSTQSQCNRASHPTGAFSTNWHHPALPSPPLPLLQYSLALFLQYWLLILNELYAFTNLYSLSWRRPRNWRAGSTTCSRLSKTHSAVWSQLQISALPLRRRSYVALSLSLSLSHTHTHTHTHQGLSFCSNGSLSEMLSLFCYDMHGTPLLLTG
jgi:hypothetical protein